MLRERLPHSGVAADRMRPTVADMFEYAIIINRYIRKVYYFILNNCANYTVYKTTVITDIGRRKVDRSIVGYRHFPDSITFVYSTQYSSTQRHVRRLVVRHGYAESFSRV